MITLFYSAISNLIQINARGEKRKNYALTSTLQSTTNE